MGRQRTVMYGEGKVMVSHVVQCKEKKSVKFRANIPVR